MAIDTNHFKAKLKDELKRLEVELKSVGEKNPRNKEDWEPKPADFRPDTADESEIADSLEEFGTNSAILKQLEIRFNEVKAALERIENGEYGICKISGEEIELPRLEANPAAETCIKHKDEGVIL